MAAQPPQHRVKTAAVEAQLLQPRPKGSNHKDVGGDPVPADTDKNMNVESVGSIGEDPVLADTDANAVGSEGENDRGKHQV